jgi:hypothetical protein
MFEENLPIHVSVMVDFFGLILNMFDFEILFSKMPRSLPLWCVRGNLSWKCRFIVQQGLMLDKIFVTRKHIFLQTYLTKSLVSAWIRV